MKVAYQTDIGHQRQENQDRVGAVINSDGNQLLIIADGIGGNHNGDLAAELTVSSLIQQFKNKPPKTALEAIRWFAREVQIVNDQIIKRSQSNPQLHDMGTTMVAAIIIADTVIIANIGDSRGYILHDQLLTQVTIDHSLVNELVKTGDISADEALKLPQSNIITRAIGISSEAQVEVNRFKLKENDQLLLCSDGLFKMVSQDKLIKVLENSSSLKTKCDQLINLANAAGGPDNITVLIGKMSDQEG